MDRKIKIIIIGAIILIVIIGAGIFQYDSLFGSPQKQAEPERFTISLDATEQDIIQKLHEQGFIKSEWGFNFILGRKNLHNEIQPGGYRVSKSMNAWQIAEILTSEPYMKWVIIPEGLRKEQIAEILAETLSWNDQKKSDWINKFTAMKYDYVEGVYFPDTYLIPIDETPLDVAQRFINKFNEKFAPYADKFTAANIKWTTALKIASIIQRETADKADMPLIAGIIWNRLLKNMKLEIDATVQYVRDDQVHFKDDSCQDPESAARKQDFCYNPELLQPTAEYISEGSWWSSIKVADKQIDSPYNTYLYKGLPPHPIANPGIDAIDAVLNSTETECLFYLHDSNKQIHCAKTYEEHLENIEKYLK